MDVSARLRADAAPDATRERRALLLVVDAGSTLLENGGEVFRVQQTMEIMAANLGISIISHSVCREEERRGELVVVPIENCRMLREINLVYPEDFPYPEMLQELRAEYEKRQ